jgi:hypothetical protein
MAGCAGFTVLALSKYATIPSLATYNGNEKLHTGNPAG